MSSTSTKTTSQNHALKNLFRQAKHYCDQATTNLNLEKAVSDISARFDELTAEQRRDLQEIGRIMTASNAPPIEGMSKPGSFMLKLTEDRMHMLMTVRPPLAGGKPATTSQVIESLKQKNIRSGVNMPRINTALQAASQGQEQVDIAIVQGQPPTPGKDGQVHLFARKSLNQPLEKIQHESIDLDQTAQLLCRKDDCILIHHPPVPGMPGHDAVGETIAAPEVQDIIVEPGEHVAVDENRMVARITGMIQLQKSRLSILPVLYFAQDVTTAQGKIDFQGQVIVKGNVRAGVSIVATEDITIHGNVEAACINSLNQSVIIKQGIVGRGEAIITAARDISARFVENATLRADGNVCIENGAMHSHIVAGEKLEVIQGKGHLVGGASLAGQLIAVRILGTTSGQKTQVAAGIGARAMKIITRLDLQTHRLTTSLQQCREIIQSIHHLVRDPSSMDVPMLEQLTRLKQLQLVLEIRLESLQSRRQRVMNQATRDGQGKIEILEDVYAGLVVRIGNQELQYTDTARARQFVLDAKTEKIVCQPLKR